jgi:hypothetical protein
MMEKSPVDDFLSILNPSSFVELSIHSNAILLADTVIVRLDGELGRIIFSVSSCFLQLDIKKMLNVSDI